MSPTLAVILTLFGLGLVFVALLVLSQSEEQPPKRKRERGQVIRLKPPDTDEAA